MKSSTVCAFFLLAPLLAGCVTDGSSGHYRSHHGRSSGWGHAERAAWSDRNWHSERHDRSERRHRDGDWREKGGRTVRGRDGGERDGRGRDDRREDRDDERRERRQ